MAAREHQGLQIALIIFVMLTIVLGVTSFWFFDQFKNERLKSQADNKSMNKAIADQKKAVEDLERVKRMLNFGPRDEVSAIETAFKKDMDTYGKTFPEANQHYRFVVAELDKQKKAKDAELIDAAAREQSLEARIAKDEATKKTELATYQESLDKTQQDATAEREKFNVDRTKIKQADTDLAKKLEDKRKEMDEAVNKINKDLEEALGRLQNVVKTNEALVSKDKDIKESMEQSDGKVTWVNQRARVVWVNLGSDDGLHRQVSFSVVGADENNPLKADKKGSVEVTRVLDRHLAEAKILDDSPSNPIMPGDNVFSAAWQPGRAEHFALAGTMDIDKDGLSDRQRIRDLITLNGGIIDLELKDDGSLVGGMTVQTRYLVMGERPSDKSTNGDLLKNFSTVISEAKALPVKTISVVQLMDYLGYSAKERTIPLGADSRGSDFKPRAPEGVQRHSSNNMFQRRRGTPTTGSKSAY